MYGQTVGLSTDLFSQVLLSAFGSHQTRASLTGQPIAESETRDEQIGDPCAWTVDIAHG